MAAKYKPSFAKNMIRRSLRGEIDSPPLDHEIAKAIDHFNNHCAYCGTDLQDIRMQLDHLDSEGTNHISNRVPACANCNESEKLDKPWEAYLLSKSSNEEVYLGRRKLISDWIDISLQDISEVKELLSIVESEIESAINAYDKALSRIRAIRSSREA